MAFDLKIPFSPSSNNGFAMINIHDKQEKSLREGFQCVLVKKVNYTGMHDIIFQNGQGYFNTFLTHTINSEYFRITTG